MKEKYISTQIAASNMNAPSKSEYTEAPVPQNVHGLFKGF